MPARRHRPRRKTIDTVLNSIPLARGTPNALDWNRTQSTSTRANSKRAIAVNAIRIRTSSSHVTTAVSDGMTTSSSIRFGGRLNQKGNVCFDRLIETSAPGQSSNHYYLFYLKIKCLENFRESKERIDVAQPTLRSDTQIIARISIHGLWIEAQAIVQPRDGLQFLHVEILRSG